MAMIEVGGSLTLEQLLIREQAGEAAVGKTAEELARATGHNVKWVRAKLAALKAEGKVEVVKARRYRLDDQPYTAPAYRLAEAAPRATGSFDSL